MASVDFVTIQSSFGDNTDDEEMMIIECEVATEKLYLFDLPDEVLAKIFSNLNLIELSRLAITSKALSNWIRAYYILCPGGPARLILRAMKGNCVPGCGLMWPKDPEQESQYNQFFRELGKFFRRVTMCLPFMESLRLMVKFFRQFFQLPSPNQMNLSYLNERFILKNMGLFINCMYEAWDTNKCTRVLDFLDDVFEVRPMIARILAARLGEYASLEFFVRCYFRLLFLDHLSSLDPACFVLWITSIFRKYAYGENNADVNRAKILAILYAPLVEERGDILGYEPNEDSHENEDGLGDERNQGSMLANIKDAGRWATGPVDAMSKNFKEPVPKIAWITLTTGKFSSEQLGELVNHALQLTHDEKEPWNDDQIFSLIHNLTELPNRWSIENVALFLNLGGEQVIKMYLRRSFSEGNAYHVGRLIDSLDNLNDEKTIDFFQYMIDELDLSSTTLTFCLRVLMAQMEAQSQRLRRILYPFSDSSSSRSL